MTLPHPSKTELQHYAVGRLSPEAIDRVARHVDGCDDCQETLSGLNLTDDTLVLGLRSDQAKEPPEDEASLDRIISRAVAGVGATPATAFGPYLLGEQIGQGGMGAVYRATHTKLAKPVALKLLPAEIGEAPHRVARFEREMQSIGGLEHENVVRAYDAGEHDGRHFLSMELLDGLDLGALVRSEGVLPVAEACACIRQAALGLAHAHARGILHRDIKPSNLMLTTDGVVKLLDLGLASAIGPADADGAESDPKIALADADGDAASEPITTAGQLLGTPDYMAPEQCAAGPLDHRSDLYSLGATMYFLLTGTAPFASRKYKKLNDKLAAIVDRAAPPIARRRPDLPAEVCEVVDRLLTNSADDRFQSAADVATALEPLARGADLPGLLADHEVQPAPPKQQKSGSFRNWLALATTLTLMGLAAYLTLTITTPNGTLEIEVPQDAPKHLTVEVTRDGSTKVASDAAGWSLSLKQGEWDVALDDPSNAFALDDDAVTITSQQKEVVRVTKREPQQASKQQESPPNITLPPLPPLLPPPTPVAFEVADPLRADWPLQVDLYTMKYDLDENQSVTIEGGEWQVKDRYVGRDGDRTLIDERITLVLVDKAKGFWPVIIKMAVGEAEAFSEKLKRATAEVARLENEMSRAPLVAVMRLAPYPLNGFGRASLPQEVKLDVRTGYSESDGPTDPRPALVITDTAEKYTALVVWQSLDDARRLRADLGRVIRTKRASMKQRIALRTPHRFYVGARRGGGADVTAEDRRPGSSEVFTLEWQDLQRSRGTLRTREGFYISAQQGGGGNLDAKEKEPKTSEVFDFEWLSTERTKTRIRTREGHYVQAKKGGQLSAPSKNPAEATEFTIIDAP